MVSEAALHDLCFDRAAAAMMGSADCDMNAPDFQEKFSVQV